MDDYTTLPFTIQKKKQPSFWPAFLSSVADELDRREKLRETIAQMQRQQQMNVQTAQQIAAAQQPFELQRIQATQQAELQRALAEQKTKDAEQQASDIATYLPQMGPVESPPGFGPPPPEVEQRWKLQEVPVLKQFQTKILPELGRISIAQQAEAGRTERFQPRPVTSPPPTPDEKRTAQIQAEARRLYVQADMRKSNPNLTILQRKALPEPTQVANDYLQAQGLPPMFTSPADTSTAPPTGPLTALSDSVLIQIANTKEGTPDGEAAYQILRKRHPTMAP